MSIQHQCLNEVQNHETPLTPSLLAGICLSACFLCRQGGRTVPGYCKRQRSAQALEQRALSAARVFSSVKTFQEQQEAEKRQQNQLKQQPRCSTQNTPPEPPLTQPRGNLHPPPAPVKTNQTWGKQSLQAGGNPKGSPTAGEA